MQSADGRGRTWRGPSLRRIAVRSPHKGWHFFSFRFSLRYCSTLTGNLTATTSTRLLRVLKYCIHSDFWTHTMIHIPIYICTTTTVVLVHFTVLTHATHDMKCNTGLLQYSTEYSRISFLLFFLNPTHRSFQC